MASSAECFLDTISSTVAALHKSSLAERVFVAGSVEYEISTTSYFSQQEQQLQPSVIVIPQSAQEVADAISILVKHRSLTAGSFFAVRSGGKTPWKGSANIQAGITIDLSALNHVIPSDDRRTVKVGAGARWGDVYPVLDALLLGISGGRDSTVGVGGLSLGGGLSFFGPQRGFVCDSIVQAEVVLADGSLIQASESSHADLWKALKGGSGNFGIVTSFDFEAFKLGDIWGGQSVWPVSTASQHLDALYDFTADRSTDLRATVIQSFALYQGNVIINAGLKFVAPVENPPVFKPFLDIQGCLYSSNKITNMTSAAIEQSGFNTNGRRQALMSTSFVNDRDMLQHAFEAWNVSVPLVSHIKNVSWSMTFQPLTPAITERGAQMGGNVLGLEEAPPLIIAQIAISWDDAQDDDLLVNKALSILKDVEETAKVVGKFHGYVYLNYAWPTQDPVNSYGEANKKFMQAVSKKYDSEGLFQTGLAGGFKLFT